MHFSTEGSWKDHLKGCVEPGKDDEAGDCKEQTEQLSYGGADFTT